MKHDFTLFGSKEFQNKKNTYYPIRESINSLDDLLRVASYDHVAAQYNNNHRGNDDFLQSNCIMLDCDNSHSDNPNEWIYPETIKVIFRNVEFYIVYSRHHMQEKDGESARPRFHVYFPLKNFIYDLNIYKPVKNAIVKKRYVYLHFDNGAKDGARFFYGVENPKGEFVAGELALDEFIDFEALIAEPIVEETKTAKTKKSKKETAKSNNDNVKELLNRDTFPQGMRNDSLNKILWYLLHEYGETEKTLGLFQQQAQKCEPPLPENDLIAMWYHAQSDFERECEQKGIDPTKPREAQKTLKEKSLAFLEGKNLFFHGSIKGGYFWQYDSTLGCWIRLNDADLLADIAAFFDNELPPKEKAAIYSTVRDMVNKPIMPIFNAKPVQVFTNGTLELNTGILRENRANDYMTWAHDFPYDVNATCPSYDKFIREVACDEPSRMALLDDIAAYCLYDDCRLQKFFILIGDGANGKSTYLAIIEDLFKSSNNRGYSQSVTNIKPEKLDDPTQRIHLQNSIVNIAADISPNLSRCVADIKSITGGDTLTGYLKFHDVVSFKTRAKLICSCNDMIRVNDSSVGFKRRLVFCKFEASFLGIADYSLPQRLKAELPGIFNRVYRNYKAMLIRERENGNEAIRLCVDQEEFLSEFKVIADPVATFWDEYSLDILPEGEILKSQVFELYAQFCERNSRFAGVEEVFHTRLQKILRDKNITFEITQHRENGTRKRYYQFIIKPEDLRRE